MGALSLTVREVELLDELAARAVMSPPLPATAVEVLRGRQRRRRGVRWASTAAVTFASFLVVLNGVGTDTVTIRMASSRNTAEAGVAFSGSEEVVSLQEIAPDQLVFLRDVWSEFEFAAKIEAWDRRIVVFRDSEGRRCLGTDDSNRGWGCGVPHPSPTSPRNIVYWPEPSMSAVAAWVDLPKATTSVGFESGRHRFTQTPMRGVAAFPYAPGSADTFTMTAYSKDGRVIATARSGATSLYGRCVPALWRPC
jgi:hypothetical protein